MKSRERQWLVAGALAAMLLAGCASEAYVGTYPETYHSGPDVYVYSGRPHHYYRHRYVGRPPEYYYGEQHGVYVVPEPAHRYRW